MTFRKFSLVPFPRAGGVPEVRIEGSISREGDRLSVRWDILGKLSDLSIPSPEIVPGRKEHLWEETCLELFLRPADSERYWEFNLSPSGNWNVYRFESVRTGMEIEPGFSTMPFDVLVEPDALRLSLEADIGKLVPAGLSLEAGIAAVVKTAGGGKSHWALAHPGPRPDFHRKEGFRLTLPGTDRP